jgi:hypothetical protein
MHGWVCVHEFMFITQSINLVLWLDVCCVCVHTCIRTYIHMHPYCWSVLEGSTPSCPHFVSPAALPMTQRPRNIQTCICMYVQMHGDKRWLCLRARVCVHAYSVRLHELAGHLPLTTLVSTRNFTHIKSTRILQELTRMLSPYIFCSITFVHTTGTWKIGLIFLLSYLHKQSTTISTHLHTCIACIRARPRIRTHMHT